MRYSIKSRVLDQNIEAVQKRASGCAATEVGLDNVSDNSLLSRVEPCLRLTGTVTEMHDYGSHCTELKGRVRVTTQGYRSLGKRARYTGCQYPVGSGQPLPEDIRRPESAAGGQTAS